MVEYLAYSSVWNACTWKKSGPKKFFLPPHLLCDLIPRQNEWAEPSPYEPPKKLNPFRIWGYPLSLFPYFPPIALKNPRVGRKILKQFLSKRFLLDLVFRETSLAIKRISRIQYPFIDYIPLEKWLGTRRCNPSFRIKKPGVGNKPLEFTILGIPSRNGKFTP